MLGMTVVGTLLLPELWLDPLGRLSKNLPIAALLLIVAGCGAGRWLARRLLLKA